MAKQMTLASKLRLGLVILVLVILAIIALQNTETVETQVLWIALPMPRAVLLLVMTLIGFVLGMLASFVLRKRRVV